MKTKIIIGLFASAFLFPSCEKEAKIQVTNNVHNVRLDNISFSKVQIGSYLLPGESTETTITDKNRNISFPLSEPLEFYMVKGDKRVYLKTKDYFNVDDGETLKIIIDDDTELTNPMN
jgi:hypothetical protein